MRVFGNLMNRIAEECDSPKPEVGMGVTQYLYSDREPFTIVKILSPKRIAVTRDLATRVDGNGMSECQAYMFATDPEAAEKILRQNKRGQWKEEGSPKGCIFVLGLRSKYYDYSF